MYRARASDWNHLRSTQPAAAALSLVSGCAEQQRLQENAALGKPLTTGQTPVIKRRKSAPLEGIF